MECFSMYRRKWSKWTSAGLRPSLVSSTSLNSNRTNAASSRHCSRWSSARSCSTSPTARSAVTAAKAPFRPFRPHHSSWTSKSKWRLNLTDRIIRLRPTVTLGRPSRTRVTIHSQKTSSCVTVTLIAMTRMATPTARPREPASSSVATSSPTTLIRTAAETWSLRYHPRRRKMVKLSPAKAPTSNSGKVANRLTNAIWTVQTLALSHMMQIMAPQRSRHPRTTFTTRLKTQTSTPNNVSKYLAKSRNLLIWYSNLVTRRSDAMDNYKNAIFRQHLIV